MSKRDVVTSKVLEALPPARRKLWMSAIEVAVVADLRGSRSLHPALARLVLMGKIKRRKNSLGRWEYAR